MLLYLLLCHVLLLLHHIPAACRAAAGVEMVSQVESRSIAEIAHELAHLQHLAAAGRLTANHLSHGSITISNIGE
jgi:hypothetical protein